MPSPKPALLPITCPDFDPLPGGKCCRHYLPNGACYRPEHFMCNEWLKVNPPNALPLEQHQLFGPPQVLAPPVAPRERRAEPRWRLPRCLGRRPARALSAA